MRRRPLQAALALACVMLFLGGVLLLSRPASAQLPPNTGASPAAGVAPARADSPAASELRANLVTPAGPDTGRLPHIEAINLPEHTLDMGQLGIRPIAGPMPLRSGGAAGVPGAPHLLRPDGATIGVGNAIMVTSPDVVSQSTTSAIGTLLANFTPGETIDYYVNGALAGSFVSDASGRVAVGISTGVGLGYITFEGIGQTSGKRAGSAVQVLDAAPPVPGFAAAPHAVNSAAAGTFYAYGFRFVANSTVNLARNGVSLGTAPTNANGRFFITITPANNGDASAVYSAYTSTVGSMSGASVEERADAGVPPLGDQNPARALVDRPIISSATGGTMSVVGEGFQAGETVTLGGCTSGSVAADANGAVGLYLTAPASPAVYNCTLTGGTSARVARASVQAAALVTNAPSAINRPSSVSAAAGSFVFQYDRLLPNQTGTAYIDGVSQGPASVDANGNGFATLVPPAVVGIHAVAFLGASGQVAIAPLYIVPAQGTPTPTATRTVPPTSTATTTRTVTPAPPTNTATATATPSCAGAGGHYFTAVLSGLNETPPNNSPGAGVGVFYLDPAGTTITYTLTYTGLTGPATASHLHRGAPGQAGPIIVPFCQGSCGNPITGSAPWDPANTPALLAGNVYANVHTAQFPGGEIRGQLVERCVTPTPTTTPCAIHFTDVQPSDYFYEPVRYLYCHGVISGYGDNTFRPYNNTTRSQMVKIVVLGFNKPVATPTGGGYTFTDVPPSNPFFNYIETAASLNIVSGYACGGPGEPCDSANRPYFRPYAYVTRGQLAKIDVVAAGWTVINPATPSFQDVLPNTAFYTYVETAYCHGVISGYNCGGPGEPCGTSGKPYYRQFNDATRGQIAKIAFLSITNPPGACAAP
jgi:hypothetical protein